MNVYIKSAHTAALHSLKEKTELVAAAQRIS